MFLAARASLDLKIARSETTMAQSGPQIAPGDPRKPQNDQKLIKKIAQTGPKNDPKLSKIALITNDK